MTSLNKAICLRDLLVSHVESVNPWLSTMLLQFNVSDYRFACMSVEELEDYIAEWNAVATQAEAGRTDCL